MFTKNESQRYRCLGACHSIKSFKNIIITYQMGLSLSNMLLPVTDKTCHILLPFLCFITRGSCVKGGRVGGQVRVGGL